jgi:hypothetical protein
MQVRDSAVVTIGLFGTCGGSHWRAPFEATYAEKGIAYFNPQVEDWDPSMAAIEAAHLAEDEIILFPITKETYGTGSLAETGFSILQAIRLDDRRDFIILIERELDPKLMENSVAAKESLRARALVHEHLKKLRLSNLYVVESLDDMLAISLALYEAAKIRKGVSQFNLT